MTELQITETVDPARNVGQGSVRSGNQSAEMLVVAGRTLLRGSAGFWSTVGIANTEPGWVDVSERLGSALPFPLPSAVAAMAPGPQTLMDTAPADATSVTVRNGGLALVFGDSGVTSISVDGRTAAVSTPTGPATAKLAASPPPDWDQAVATLSGGGGALTVVPPTPPTPPASPAPPQ